MKIPVLADFIAESDIPVIYLGYPGLKVEDKLEAIKKHAREKDWTNQTEDKEMLGILQLWKSESQLMYEQCLDYKIPFSDTGQNLKRL